MVDEPEDNEPDTEDNEPYPESDGSDDESDGADGEEGLSFEDLGAAFARAAAEIDPELVSASADVSGAKTRRQRIWPSRVARRRLQTGRRGNPMMTTTRGLSR